MKKYDNIQVLRVLSCLGIFITHLAPRMGARGLAASVANFCASGVYLFFLISGFLACHSKELRPGKGWRSVLSYYCKRLFRVLPLYYAVILYNMALHCLLLRDVPPDPEGLSWLRYFFLTNAFIPGPDNFWSNLSATWTISLFCFFYLCAPLFVRLIGCGEKEEQSAAEDERLQKSAGQNEKTEKRRLYGKNLSGVFRAAALYLAALFLRYAWVAAGLFSYMMAFYYLHFFVLGMLVRELSERYRPVRAAVCFGLFAAGLEIVLVISGAGNDYFTVISWFFAELMLLTGRFSWKRGQTAVQDSYCPTGPQQPKKAMTCSKNSSSGKKGIRFSAARLFSVLDVYSYAIYLVHAVVIDGIVLLQAHVELPGIIVLMTAVLLTAIGAWLAHHLIEKPAEKLGRRLVETLRI